MPRRSHLRSLVVALAALCLAPAAAPAAPGDLDPSFSGGSLSINPRPGTVSDRLNPAEVLRLSDGRIVVIGQTASSTLFVARLTASGALDPAFGGVREISFGSSVYVEPQDVAVDSAGRLIVGGRAGSNGFLVRLTTSGALDPSFGTGGKVSTVGLVYAIAVDTDDAVYALQGGDLVVRWGATGTVDTAFGAGGSSTLAETFQEDSRMAVLADRRIVLLGKGSAAGYRLARLEGLQDAVPGVDSGNYDTTFSGDGRLTLASPTVSSSFKDGVVDSAGNAYLVGSGTDGYQLVRVRASDGTLAGLGAAGIIVRNPTPDTNESAESVAVTGSSTVVVTGYGDNGRYVQTVDTTNGVNDFVASIPCSNGSTCRVVAASGGGGQAAILLADTSFAPYAAVAAYTSALGLDTTVDGDGIAPVERLVPWGLPGASGTPLSDGSLLVWGEAGPYNNEASFLTRLTPSGARDTTFAPGGTVVADLNPSSPDYLTGVERTPDGQLYVVRTPFTRSIALTRMTGSGVDSGYATAGTASVLIAPSASSAYAFDSLVDSDGSILVAGESCCGSGLPEAREAFIARVNPSTGALSPGFAGGLPLIINRNTAGAEEVVSSLAQGSAGRIYAGGYVNSTPFVAAYNSDGSKVSGFGTDGILDLPQLAPRFSGTRVLVAPDGAGGVYVGVTVVTGSTVTATVRQVSAAGALVGTYGPATIPPPVGGGTELQAMTIDASGRLVVAGAWSTGGAQLDSLVARFTSSGTLDPAFGTAGVSVRDLGNGSVDQLTSVGVVGTAILATGWAVDGPTGEGRVIALRLRGEPDPPAGGSTTPSVSSAITSPKSKAKLRRATKLTVRGTASGIAGSVTRVEVSIRQIARGKCRYVRSAAGKVVKTQRTNKRCVAPIWIPASGTTSWKLSLKRTLPPGRYEIQTRATLSTGLVQTPAATRSVTIKAR